LYTEAMRVAGWIEHCFNAKALNGFWAFRGAGPAAKPYAAVYFAHMRARRFHVQVIRVFIEMQVLPETKDVFDFAKVHDGTLAYCTVWDITKQLLLLVPQDEIHIERLQHMDRDGTSGILLKGDGVLHVLSHARGGRKRTAPGALEQLGNTAKKEPRGRVGGGIRYVPPDGHGGRAGARHRDCHDEEDIHSFEDAEPILI
jgi:hypothetical protein